MNGNRIEFEIPTWARPTIEFRRDVGGLTVSITDEVAMDSYNRSVDLHVTMPDEQVDKLILWLFHASDAEEQTE